MKKVILLLLSFCALSVFAASPPTAHWAYKQPGAWFSSYEAACAAWVAEGSANEGVEGAYWELTFTSDISCGAERIDPVRGLLGYAGVTLIKEVRCPDGYTLVNGLCERSQEPSHCAADAGTSSVMNFTVGWARSGNPDADDHVGKVVFPNQGRGAACVGGCSWEFTDNGVAAYRSAEPFPASGLHRLSVDFTMRGAGTACTESPEDAAASPNAPEPPCPGFVGEVNGVTKCVGTASKPVTPPDGPGAGRQAGGSEDNGNPAAGKKPDTGEGSGSGGPGRTPSAGSGGNAGGPAGAAGGTRPDGTTNKPEEGKEQAACGAPGQPKCRIDESGTPSGQGAFDAANRGVDETRDGWLAEISKAKELKSDGWTWTFQLPSGCTPLELPAYNISLDVCRFQTVIHDIMSMVWLICTVMGCVWMVFNAQKN